MSHAEDKVECRTCGKLHEANDKCASVKALTEMKLIFCGICACHYGDASGKGCPEHGYTGVKVEE